MNEKRKVLGADLQFTQDEEGADLTISPSGDLKTVSHELNLGQAILSKLRTRKGELRDLGHSSLGSRLYQFVGEPNSPATRDRIRATVREVLLDEPRVKEIVRIEVRSSESDRNRVQLHISVIPIGEEVPLNIVMPFYLEVA